jgi:transcriptional regulator with XRE-family HTH domain
MYRAAKGLSQDRLAHKLGITFQQVQKYEYGTNRISFSRGYDICSALGVTIDDIVQGYSAPLERTLDADVPDLMNPLVLKFARMLGKMSPERAAKMVPKILALMDESGE